MSRRGLLSIAAIVVSSCAPRAAAPRLDERVRVIGLADEARVTDTRLALDVEPQVDSEIREVDYAIDGARVASRTAPPWGWGPDGARHRDAGEMSFGAHEIQIDLHTTRGDGRRTLHLVYASPFARVPSYARDIVPLFRDHCATCHDHGLARDLATYDRLRAMIPRLRASVREARMPPDFAIDSTSVALFTAWCDGNAPP